MDWYAAKIYGVFIQDRKEVGLMEAYPPLHEEPYPLQTRPLTIVDKDGNILVWYLPRILFEDRQMAIFNSTSTLEPELAKSFTPEKTSWRTRRSSFLDGKMPGCINMSPAWFQQGHEWYRNELEVSSLLKPTNKNIEENISWLHNMNVHFPIVNSIAQIMHPQQFRIGMEAIDKLHKDPSHLREGNTARTVLDAWHTPFSALAVISNRSTPSHRDLQSPAKGLDVMVTTGTYRDAFMVLPGIGMELYFPPGTVVALSGSLIQHGVRCSEVDRVCLALYMRSAVHEKLELSPTSWSNLSHFA
ncbi:hypothetical protein BDN72DRAFT_782361 [Pluteus cervinus]|uniref:Uncharacterized protein n=1 Tax=Pluteus cervinus TaxID=181527 RepID=A0ACD2ZYQ0_9AGAR|nr:hypothetical protein BDN72DRAFT_782361 [Pluteus cervinus]